MSPSGETKDALHPPSETMAPIGKPVRSAKAFGSPAYPSAWRRDSRAGICCGIHIPSSPRRERAGVRVKAPSNRAGARFDFKGSPPCRGRVLLREPGRSQYPYYRSSEVSVLAVSVFLALVVLLLRLVSPREIPSLLDTRLLGLFFVLILAVECARL